MSADKNRLFWACRRGMLELDIFLERYLNEAYDSLSPEKQTCFRRLLSEADPDLYSWLMGYDKPHDEELASMCHEIRTHVQTA